MSRRHAASSKPEFGEDERFDRSLHRIRVASWWLILPAVLIAGFFVKSDHAIASPVFRAAIIYTFLLVVLRLSGKRTLAELSPFDLILILIISEAVQPALVADDNRLTSAFLIVFTLVGIDVLLAEVKERSHRADRLIDDVPTVLVNDGVMNRAAMLRERIDEDEILEAARRQQGLATMDEIRFAILERTGGISVIPWQSNQ